MVDITVSQSQRELELIMDGHSTSTQLRDFGTDCKDWFYLPKVRPESHRTRTIYIII